MEYLGNQRDPLATATVIRALREDIAPELSVPRWVSPFQAFRVLTPPLYRWGVRKARDMDAAGGRR